jgi:hypothetical protein
VSFFIPSEAPKLANRKTKAELAGMTEDEQVSWHALCWLRLAAHILL